MIVLIAKMTICSNWNLAFKSFDQMHANLSRYENKNAEKKPSYGNGKVRGFNTSV